MKALHHTDKIILELREDGRQVWSDGSGHVIDDDESRSKPLAVSMPLSLYCELALLSTLTGITSPVIMCRLLTDYLRPGTIPPMIRYSIPELLEQRAQALLHPQIPKPRTITQRLKDPIPFVDCVPVFDPPPARKGRPPAQKISNYMLRKFAAGYPLPDEISFSEAEFNKLRSYRAEYLALNPDIEE